MKAVLTEPKIQPDPRVQSIILRIDKDPKGAPLVKRMAETVNLSSSRLYALFKTGMCTSPARYLKAIRMADAKQLLEDTHLSVKEIAARVGFNDLSHFVRDFKKRYNLTPTECRHLSLRSRQTFPENLLHGSEDWPTYSKNGQRNSLEPLRNSK